MLHGQHVVTCCELSITIQLISISAQAQQHLTTKFSISEHPLPNAIGALKHVANQSLHLLPMYVFHQVGCF